MGQRRALISYFYFDHLILLQFMITYFSISKQKKTVDALFCSLQSLALIIGCQNFVLEMMRSDLGQMPYLESTVVFL